MKGLHVVHGLRASFGNPWRSQYYSGYYCRPYYAPRYYPRAYYFGGYCHRYWRPHYYYGNCGPYRRQ